MNYKRVSVVWQDAALNNGWMESHKSAGLRSVETTGFLIYKDTEVVKVALTLDHDSGCFADVLCVPRQWCRKIRYL